MPSLHSRQHQLLALLTRNAYVVICHHQPITTIWSASGWTVFRTQQRCQLVRKVCPPHPVAAPWLCRYTVTGGRSMHYVWDQLACCPGCTGCRPFGLSAWIIVFAAAQLILTQARTPHRAGTLSAIWLRAGAPFRNGDLRDRNLTCRRERRVLELLFTLSGPEKVSALQLTVIARQYKMCVATLVYAAWPKGQSSFLYSMTADAHHAMYAPSCSLAAFQGTSRLHYCWLALAHGVFNWKLQKLALQSRPSAGVCKPLILC